jgi:hypothetical protein
MAGGRQLGGHAVYRAAMLTLLRALLMSATVVAVGVTAFLVASVVLEWL